MEVLKKKKTSLRTAVTKSLNAVNSLLAAEDCDEIEVASAYQILEEKINSLSETMSQIYQLMFEDAAVTEQTIEKETDEADEYKRKFFVIKSKIEARKQEKEAAREAASSRNSTASPIQNVITLPSENKNSVKFPRIELVKFTGEVREWLSFWSLFKKIHEDTKLDNGDKMYFLSQSVVANSPAENVVKSFPPTGENYQKAIDRLKARFGREDLQIEVYVRELLQLILQNAVRKASKDKDALPKLDLSVLYDKLESHLRALETLGVATDKCAAMLLPLVESSLPEELLRAWQRSSVGSTLDETQGADASTQSQERLTKLINFIGGEVQNEMRISMATKGFDLGSSELGNTDHKRDTKHSNSGRVPSAMGLHATEKRFRCIFCDSPNHKSADCPNALSWSLERRQDSVIEKNACFNCLYIGHSARRCRANVTCEKENCKGRHVTLMCRGNKSNSEQSNEGKSGSNLSKEELSLASVSRVSSVFLQILLVRLRGKNDEILVRALIDSGCQRSYITKAAAEKIGYEPIGEQIMEHLVFGGGVTEAVNHKKYKARVSSLTGDFACNFDVLDQDTICAKAPRVPTGKWCEELRDLKIELTDYCESDKPISMLIGADIAGKLFTGKKVQLACGLVALETALGWTVMGSVPGKKKEDAVLSALSMHVASYDIEDLWALDTLGIKDPLARKSKKQQQEDFCTEFLKHVKINAEGRYEVPLPWLEAHPPLSSNKAISDRRIPTLVKKLKAEGHYEAYDGVLEEWREEGIIEHVPADASEDEGHILPHKHVVKQNSTTNIRPVFDASAKQPPNPSLNECLDKGLNFIELITAVLMRFREGSIGVISDIKKAFLQISVDPKDRDFLRFIWFDKFGNRIILRHCRVVFGVCSSPFILAAVIKLHLEKILESLDAGLALDFSVENISKLLNSFYVDNCVTSVNSEEQLHSFMAEAKRAMASAKFDLRGWEYSYDITREHQTAVLGMVWDKHQDVLYLNIENLKNIRTDKVTKRIMLSSAHRVFDPLGFVCPITLTPRLLLQETWSKNLWWDDEVDEEISKQFNKWAVELQFLDQIKIRRCLIGDINKEDKVSLHTFCDASKIAYAAVTFLRVERRSGVSVGFVQAKARVAPVKRDDEPKYSIPRLELLAASIGVRLTVSIVEAMNLKDVEINYWSDSSTVLAWIHRDTNWGVFVFNRVKEICDFSRREQWRHVPGHLNPADLPSRGCTVSQLIESKWWEGPEWLRDITTWPTSNFTCDEEEVKREQRKTAIKIATNTGICLSNGSSREPSWYSNRFSNYAKLLRVQAWVKRFYINSRRTAEHREKSREITVNEIEDAEISLVKDIQKDSFEGLEDKLIKHLNPFYDEKGVIRLKTKILLREDTYNFRCPMILPAGNDITNLIIKDKHDREKHSGVQITMSILREKFWILGGRKTIRAVIKRCIECQRHEAQPLEMKPAPLPLDRIREAAVFEIIGVDLTGPVYLKDGQKAWICIFTCAVFRAVHFELVKSLNTASFLMALRRHIARRGRPTVVFSDNGTNFVGLNNELEKLDFQKVAKTLAIEGIEWKFNPPSAPWWGGFWERLIGILKKLLRRSLKRSCLDYEEMLTTLVDCEAIVNARPITFMADNDSEVMPLTPSHFLLENREIGVVDLDHIENYCFQKRYAYRQKVKQELRDRFRNEYLGSLSYPRKKYNNMSNINVGDLVLIGSDNTKRMDWPLAKIKDVYKGRDGNIRVVRLITGNGELTRPIQRIFPLELNGDFAKEDVSKVCEKRCVVTRSGRIVKEPKRYVAT